MNETKCQKWTGHFNPVGLEVATSWLKWSEQFEFYMKATAKDTKGSDVQVAILLIFLGVEAIDIYRLFEWVTARGGQRRHCYRQGQVQGVFHATCERSVRMVQVPEKKAGTDRNFREFLDGHCIEFGVV